MTKGTRRVTTVVAVVGLITLSVLGLVGAFTSSPTRTFKTVVERKGVVPAHSQIFNIVSDKGVIPLISKCAESYRLHFKINGKEAVAVVEKKLVDELNIGDGVEVDYTVDPLTGEIQPVTVRPVQPK